MVQGLGTATHLRFSSSLCTDLPRSGGRVRSRQAPPFPTVPSPPFPKAQNPPQQAQQERRKVCLQAAGGPYEGSSLIGWQVPPGHRWQLSREASVQQWGLQGEVLTQVAANKEKEEA